MLRQTKIVLVMLAVFTLITGIIYPLLVTGIAQLAFNRQANGSLMTEKGVTLGSELIGQPFSDPKYFWGRLSATDPLPYSAGSSAGSNFAQPNPALSASVQERIKALMQADPQNNHPVPVDLVTFSGSGLDPHISPAAANYQAARVARVRGLSFEKVNALIPQYSEGRLWGILGEPRVNVLKLNLALDGLR